VRPDIRAACGWESSSKWSRFNVCRLKAAGSSLRTLAGSRRWKA
jgi:hypothetical protein